MIVEESILRFFEPKLAFFGFKYNPKESDAIQGIVVFSRMYWGTRQDVVISRVELRKDDLEIFLAKSFESLEKRINSKSETLWLSTKCVAVTLRHEAACVALTSEGAGHIAVEPKETDSDYIYYGIRERGTGLPLMWCQSAQTDFHQLFRQIIHVFYIAGLAWFEEQVSDIRAFHNKLDKRRLRLLEKFKAGGSMPNSH
jgi:hypothetical protein